MNKEAIRLLENMVEILWNRDNPEYDTKYSTIWRNVIEELGKDYKNYAETKDNRYGDKILSFLQAANYLNHKVDGLNELFEKLR